MRCGVLEGLLVQPLTFLSSGEIPDSTHPLALDANNIERVLRTRYPYGGNT